MLNVRGFGGGGGGACSFLPINPNIAIFIFLAPMFNKTNEIYINTTFKSRKYCAHAARAAYYS
tara:strand:+ start:1023 stop:1211 length:189 start_codon:yes stop_codon:yes gene_type:complete